MLAQQLPSNPQEKLICEESDQAARPAHPSINVEENDPNEGGIVTGLVLSSSNTHLTADCVAQSSSAIESKVSDLSPNPTPHPSSALRSITTDAPEVNSIDIVVASHVHPDSLSLSTKPTSRIPPATPGGHEITPIDLRTALEPPSSSNFGRPVAAVASASAHEASKETSAQIILPTGSFNSFAEEGAHTFARLSRHGSARSHPLPSLPHEIGSANSQLQPLPQARTSTLDWIIPVEKVVPKVTVGDRLHPTLLQAQTERGKYASRAKFTGYALNLAIGLQVLLGSLTTGVAAAAKDGRQAAIATTVLGLLSTVVASYLARTRGSNEPENSNSRVKDLDHFIRDVESFHMDHGHSTEGEHESHLFRFRSRFEELLGNISGEQKKTTSSV